MRFELWKNGEAVEIGEEFEWTYGVQTDQDKREALEAAAISRAWEIGALAYELRNPQWREITHRSFECREIDENTVEVTTPVGTFTLNATRAKKGGRKTAVTAGHGMTGFGATASEDQAAPPVQAVGRLNAPRQQGGDWTWQPEHFVYEDGTSSDFLGSYPIRVVLK